MKGPQKGEEDRRGSRNGGGFLLPFPMLQAQSEQATLAIMIARRGMKGKDARGIDPKGEEEEEEEATHGPFLASASASVVPK